MQPVSLQERIHTIDIIRGFALLGILIANMVAFKLPLLWGQQELYTEFIIPENALDATLVWLTAFFVDGKFYPMFSMLFGLGFYIFYTRLEQKSLPAVKFFMKRLSFLLVLGLLHLIFVWSGDILVTYALTGFLLPLFVKLSATALKVWAISIYAVSVIAFTLLNVVNGLIISSGMLSSADLDGLLPSMDETVQVLSTGTYGEILGNRFVNEVTSILFQAPLLIGTILPLFLIGLYFGREGMFSDVSSHVRRWRKVLILGGVIGLPVVLLGVLLRFGGLGLEPALAYPLSEGLNMVGGPFLMLFYVAGLVLLLRRESLERVLLPFAAVGRMALTNYLMQSVVMVTLFYGFGFGLMGEVSKSQGVLIAVGFYAVQVVLSWLYLKRFRQGPFEAAWRKFTYFSRG